MSVLTESHKGKAVGSRRQSSELYCGKPRNTRGSQKLVEAKEDPPLEAAWCCLHLVFILVASRAVRIHFCVLSHHAWGNIVAATGNQYS